MYAVVDENSRMLCEGIVELTPKPCEVVTSFVLFHHADIDRQIDRQREREREIRGVNPPNSNETESPILPIPPCSFPYVPSFPLLLSSLPLKFSLQKVLKLCIAAG